MLDFDDRPWGRWEEYLNEPGYRVKRLIVAPHEALSLQSHEKRSEVWVIVSGHGIITRGPRSFIAQVGDVVEIPVGEKHRLENTGLDPLIVIETQLGECVEEDIQRYEDRYNRPTVSAG